MTNHTYTQPTAVIGWISKITGYASHGQPIPRHEAEQAIIYLNHKHKEIDHFLIPATRSSK